jgi:hypothetical protein
VHSEFVVGFGFDSTSSIEMFFFKAYNSLLVYLLHFAPVMSMAYTTLTYHLMVQEFNSPQ